MSQLQKEITLLSGIGQLSTTLLGTGLFMIPAIAASIAGAASLWAWLILFVLICPVALTFAQLGKRYPNAGGTAYFVRQAFDARTERAVAWLFVSVIPVGVPAAVALAGGFLQQLLPSQLSHPLFAQGLTVALLIYVSLLGSKTSAHLQTLIAVAIFALIIGFFWQGDIGYSDITMPSLSQGDGLSIGSALAVMFWCFVGIEAFAHMGEEFKNPQRDFPIAIIVGCFIAGGVYWASSVVILKFQAYGTTEFDSASIPWLSNLLFGSEWRLLISLLGFAACFASLNLYTQSLARMIWSQAKQTNPHGSLASLNQRGVPDIATALVAAIVLLACVIGEITALDLEFFLKLANGIFVLIYLLAMLAAYRLLSGGVKYLAALSLTLCVFVFICLGWSMLYASVVFAALMMTGQKAPSIIKS